MNGRIEYEKNSRKLLVHQTWVLALLYLEFSYYKLKNGSTTGKEKIEEVIYFSSLTASHLKTWWKWAMSPSDVHAQKSQLDLNSSPAQT